MFLRISIFDPSRYTEIDILKNGTSEICRNASWKSSDSVVPSATFHFVKQGMVGMKWNKTNALLKDGGQKMLPFQKCIILWSTVYLILGSKDDWNIHQSKQMDEKLQFIQSSFRVMSVCLNKTCHEHCVINEFWQAQISEAGGMVFLTRTNWFNGSKLAKMKKSIPDMPLP